jgi:hypothetical protein
MVAALGMLVPATISLTTYGSGATVVHTRMDMDLTDTEAFSDCPDINPVFITSGVLQLDGTGVLNQNSAHVKAHINSQGVTGFDEVTLASYRLIEVADSEIDIDLDPVTLTGKGTINARAALIGQGSAPNENAHTLIDLTVNPDGTITATLDKLTIDCQ